MSFLSKVVAASSPLARVIEIAKKAKFDQPKHAYWECTNFSNAAKKFLSEHGVKVKTYSVSLEFEKDIGEVTKGESAGHTFLVTDDGKTYDFTLRQFKPRSKFPYVSTLSDPLYRMAVKKNFAYDQDGSDHWYSLLTKEAEITAEDADGSIITWSKPIFRGLKKVKDKSGIKPDATTFDGPKFYGHGIYYHINSSQAAQWIGDIGVVVKSVPTRPLRLKQFLKERNRVDQLKDIGDLDGVYLSNRNQEAGPQIILKESSAVKQKGYWVYTAVDTNWEHAKQLDPKLMKKL